MMTITMSTTSMVVTMVVMTMTTNFRSVEWLCS